MPSFSKSSDATSLHPLIRTLRYKKPEDAKMALEQMEGFELAGRAVILLPIPMYVYRGLIQSLSSGSILCMKRVQSEGRSKTPLRRMAVRDLDPKYSLCIDMVQELT